MALNKTLDYYSEALPVSGRALFLRTSFNHSLLNSLKYLLEVCEEIIPSDLYSKTLQKLNSLNPDLKLSGLLGAIHENILKGIEQKDIPRINQIAEKLCNDNFKTTQLVYINMADLDNCYSQLVKEIFSKEITRKVKFFTLSFEDFEQVKSSIQKGIKILKRSFPDFFSEFQELVGEILILKAQGLIQGSSADLFGMIYKCYLHKWEKITDILEFLIHEQSHLYVHLLNNADEMVRNASEMYYSPLRQEKRPLMGIYHAVFILARVHLILKKGLTKKVIPEIEKDYCHNLLKDYKKFFDESYNILQKHADMTPLGRALIESASKLL